MALPVIASFGALRLWNNRKKKNETEEPKPSATLIETVGNNHFTGNVKDTYFCVGDQLLRVSNIRITNIHVGSSQKVTDKITITSGDKTIFREKLNDEWVSVPEILVHSAIIRLETKTKDPIQFSIYYNDNTNSQIPQA